jgi:hypothetical protein
MDVGTKRPHPILELGDGFLEPGPLQSGFELPGGAVWQPSLVVYGTYRTALQTFDGPGPRVSEWANDLDLFANLQLSGTERLVVGISPFEYRGDYTGYRFEPHSDAQSELNGHLTTLFFEGELGELLPNVDLADRHSLDYGFSVGRQRIRLQEGVLVDDVFDSIGVVRHSLHTPWTSGLRVTALYGWNHVSRGDGRVDDGANLAMLSASADTERSTIDADLVFVGGDGSRGDGIFGGFSAARRVELFDRSISTDLRVLFSHALDREAPGIQNGELLMLQLGLTPRGKIFDWTYLDLFAAIDNFSSAARRYDSGGQLGLVGILFASPGIGRYGAPLSPDSNDAVGFALGRQVISGDLSKQVVVELAGKLGVGSNDRSAIALGARYEQAIGSHYVLRFDVHGVADHGSPGFGARTEILVKF